jgi:16S rRNA (adenine1518-N6/adenine1519-N6)-dimethyltransferase
MKLQTKKSLGQHFLKSAAYLRAIADAADIAAGDRVLEVGPGEGALTRELLSRGAHVVAVEKDNRLIPMLQVTFDKELHTGTLVLHEGDALELDTEHTVGKGLYKLVANIPYYITGALLKKFLSGEHQPSTLVFLVQKEVAERIAKSKKESILSLSVKAYGSVTYVKTVPAGAFAPPPEVDSAILLVSNISKKNFANTQHEEKFFKLVRAGFAQKRKMLKKNIGTLLGAETEARMHTAGIADTARAEDVALEQWLALAAHV